MHLCSTDRVALFIDGPDLHATSRSLGFEIDYRALRDHFAQRCRLLRAFYYAPAPDADAFSTVRPLTDWLAYNGYVLPVQPGAESGRRRGRDRIDIAIVVDILELAPKLDHAVIFSGDGDLCPAISAAQRRGVRISIVSSLRTQPAAVADALRRQADAFVDLADIADDVARRPSDKANRVRGMVTD